MENNELDERVLRYLELCKRIYDRMEREGSWPWADDSQENGDVVDSADSSRNV